MISVARLASHTHRNSLASQSGKKMTSSAVHCGPCCKPIRQMQPVANRQSSVSLPLALLPNSGTVVFIGAPRVLSQSMAKNSRKLCTMWTVAQTWSICKSHSLSSVVKDDTSNCSELRASYARAVIECEQPFSSLAKCVYQASGPTPRPHLHANALFPVSSASIRLDPETTKSSHAILASGLV